MKNLINKQNFSHRLMQFIILVAHLVLLKWILYTLYQGGILPFNTLLYHFLGMALYGAFLIRFCAWFYKKQYLRELHKDAGN